MVTVPAGPEEQPLHGIRVLVTRPPHQAGAFMARLRELGAEPVAFPTIRIAPAEDLRPLDAAVAHITDYDWVIFTSRNAVGPFWERLVNAGKDARSLAGLKVGAIGPKTAAELKTIGVAVNFMPDSYVAEAIVEQIGDVAGQRVLLPRSPIARRALVDGLEARGAQVDEISAYRTVAAEPSDAAWAQLEAGDIDIATFTASSTVRNLVDMLGEEAVTRLLDGSRVACIGPITAGTARELGIRVDVVAEEHTVEGLIRVIVQDIQSRQPVG
jgi:uroporphyrinogen-III synthase